MVPPGGSVAKNLPGDAGDVVQSLGREDPVEKKTATHFSVLAWEIPWVRGTSWATVHGVSRGRHDLATEQQQQHCVQYLTLAHRSFMYFIFM